MASLAISYIRNENKRFSHDFLKVDLIPVIAVVAPTIQPKERINHKPETSSDVVLFNISIDDLGGVYLLVLILQQKGLFIDLFSVGRG